MSDTPADVEALRREITRLHAVADNTERRLRATHAVARVLSEETSVEAAMPRILAAIGGALASKLAAFWVPCGATLEMRATWTSESADHATWEQLNRRLRLAPGAGLPGRVWRDRGPAWIAEREGDEDVLRQDALIELGVHAGIGVPVILGTEVLGVIELWTAKAEAADDNLVEVLRTTGATLGQFFQHVRLQDQLRAQIEREQQMARATQLFSSSLDVDAVLNELAKIAVPWLADFCTIHVVERDDALRMLVTHHTDPAQAAKGTALLRMFSQVDRTPKAVIRALTEATSVFVPQVTEEILAAAAYDVSQLTAMRALAVVSYAVVPIIARGTAVAAISIVTADSKRKLTGDDLAVIEELANRAGLAVTNARLFAAAHETARELDAERDTLERLNDIGRKIAGELDQEALVQSVTDVATQLTGAQFGAFFYNLTDERGEESTSYALSGVSREVFAKLPMPRKTGILAPTFDGRGPVRLDDVTADARYGKNTPHKGVPDGHLPVRSYLAVPVVGRSGVVIGGLLFGHEKPGVFSDRAQRIAVGLAAHAATAMDNARLYGDAHRLISELEKTNAELDQFAYVASHDLRAPLRGISNLALWIEEDLGTTVPTKVLEQIHLLKSRAARMDKLINGILELARVGRTRQKPERVDVTELLHETIDLLGPSPTARVLIIGAMPMLVAERVALQQVFLNLIGNALQHAGRPDVVVRITATERTDDAEFAIADNGIGIGVEHHDRVWQIFQTLQARDTVEATGIGLTIVRKQVESNGGKAWIDPAAKEGATLRFTWPKRSK